MTQDRSSLRILDIDFLVDQSDDDIESVTALTFYRTAQSRSAGNGFSLEFKASDGEGGTKVAASASIATVEAWIWLSEQGVSPNVIVLDMAVTA